MRNEVWEKVIDFLQELRCSDMQRTGLVHLDNCIAEKEKLKLSRAQYVKCLDNISAQEQEIIEEYVMQLQQVAFLLRSFVATNSLNAIVIASISLALKKT